MDENKEKKFISERILGREMTLRRAFRWVLVSLACGIVFGLAVFGVNYLARRAVEKAEQKQTESIAASRQAEPETTPVTEESLPQVSESETHEKESETAIEPETEQETESGETKETEEGETDKDSNPGETVEGEGTQELFVEPELLHEALIAEREQFPFSSGDLTMVLGAQADACENIARYIVKVSNTISEVTWFESTVETQRNYSGIVVSVTEKEILVLTVADAVQADGSLSVTFHDGTRNAAVIKKASGRDSLAVLAVSAEGLGSEFLESLDPVEVKPAEGVRAGLPIITAGSPMGAVGSFGFGSINFVAEPESVEDGQHICCYSAVSSVPEKGTFLMSVDGCLLGLAMPKNEDSDVLGNCFVLAESCQNLLENLKKGNDMAWLGITGIDISFDMKYKNIPEGLYVTAVNESGPAFSAGLRRGDIIVTIGAREIKGVSDYLNFMRNLRPGESVMVTILREAARSEYKEMNLEMTAGTR